MDIKKIKTVLAFVFPLLLVSCDKAMGVYFQVQARNDLTEDVNIVYGQDLYGHNINYDVIKKGQTKVLKVSTSHEFNGLGHDKAIIYVIMNMLDTISINSSLGITENIIRKEQKLIPNDTLFEFTPIPANELKGIAVYTLVIDSTLYR
jgi:hypothetical protein